MAKATLYIILIIAIIGIMGYVLFENSNSVSGNAVNNGNNGGTGTGNFQKIVLSMQNRNYYPNIVTVKEGKPVRIYLDSSVVGCYRGFVIKDFGISKNLPTPNDYIEFTPNKKGTFRFACSMGMGTGTLIVE